MERIFESKETGMKLGYKALTRKQVRELRKNGIDLMDFAATADNMDAVLDMALPDLAPQIDELPYVETIELCKDIIGATFGTEAEVKNS